MAGISETKINLTALQRVEPTISDIIDSTSQVALYKFNQERNEWEKTEIEGTLFIYKRSIPKSEKRCHHPHYGFVIMNRLSTTNMVEPLTGGLEFQLQVPFLLYKNEKCDIYGIWFYEKDDSLRILSQFQRFINSAHHKTRCRRNRCASESESHTKVKSDEPNSIDIMTLLTQAQREYDKKSGGKKESKKGYNAKGNQDYNILASCSEKSIADKNMSTSNTENKVKSSSSQVITLKEKSSPRRRFLSSESSLNAQTESDKTLLDKLLGSSVLSTSHEKQAMPLQLPRSRALSLSDDFNRTNSYAAYDNSGDRKKSNFKGEDGTKVEEESISKSYTASCFHYMPNNHSIRTPSPIMTPEMFEQVPSSLNQGSPIFENTTLRSSPLFSGVVSLNDSFASGISQPVTPLKPQHSSTVPLLSPHIFREKNISGGQVVKSLLSTTADVASEPETVLNSYDTSLLSKEQLRDSLLYLLKNDSDMLSKIHEAYISSLKTHLNRK